MQPSTNPPASKLSLLFDKPTPTASPINANALEGQNKALYEHLKAGNTISFLEARKLGIDQLASRIESLIKYGIKITSCVIRIGGTRCNEYSLDLSRNEQIFNAARLIPAAIQAAAEPLQLEGEIWKSISGYERLYQVSNLGRVKSFKREREGVILKNIYSRPNGFTVVLVNDTGSKKIGRVHQLVAYAFLTKPEGTDTLIHKNGDHTDNRLSNLKWGTRKESNELAWWHGKMSSGAARPGSKLQEPDITRIRELARDGVEQKEIAARYSVSRGLVSEIIARKRWKHVF